MADYNTQAAFAFIPSRPPWMNGGAEGILTSTSAVQASAHLRRRRFRFSLYGFMRLSDKEKRRKSWSALIANGSLTSTPAVRARCDGVDLDKRTNGSWAPEPRHRARSTLCIWVEFDRYSLASYADERSTEGVNGHGYR